jgi:CheY-like chemotaxis protein
MPIMDGRTSANEIRKLEHSSEQSDDITPLRIDGRIPILAVSASLYESDRSNLAQDFDGWLLKPLGKYRNLLTCWSSRADARIHRLPQSADTSDGTGGPEQAVERGLPARTMGEGRFLQR